MTEMADDPRTPQMSAIETLHNALVDFTNCVGNSVEGVCSFGLTIGENYVPFDPDPDEDCDDEDESAGADCSQLWVRVMDVSEKPGQPQGFDGSSCADVMLYQLEVGILRCLHIPEGGEAPTTSEVLNQALQAMTDMNDIRCAALACEVDATLVVGSWTPLGPQGGQHGGVWTFTMEL